MLAKNTAEIADETKARRAALGLWLKEQRLARGLSQRELAGALNLEYYTFISQLENGRGKIPPGRYREWAAALGVDARTFVAKLLCFYDPVSYDILKL